MDKKLVEEIKDRSCGLCEICGGRGEQIHHIFGGNGRRRKTERKECLKLLCSRCHTKLHQNGINAVELKIIAQRELLEQGYTLDEVREITGGKIYLE